MKRAWFVFGRFNPPTIGHKKMLDQLKKLAGQEDYYIWPTRTHGKPDNPLSHDTKVGWMDLMFPEHSPHIESHSDIKKIEFVLQWLMMEGYTDVVLVCGSDRTLSFDFIKKHNKKRSEKSGAAYYAFDTVEIDSTGLNRDPDSNNADGMSASKMRAAAKKVDTVDFLKGVDGLLNTGDALTLMEDVREGLGL